MQSTASGPHHGCSCAGCAQASNSRAALARMVRRTISVTVGAAAPGAPWSAAMLAPPFAATVIGLGFDHARQSVEAALPETPIVVEPRFGRLHRSGRERALMHPAVDAARDQSGGFEHADVPGNRRQ